MKYLVWKALARSVILESIRRKDLWVIAILSFLILISAGALGFFGFSGLQSFAKDLAVNVLGGMTAIVAVLTSCRVIPEEIKNRTLYPLLARPITRLDLLIGKWLGAIAVSWLSFIILASVTALALTFFGVQFELIMVQYAIAKMMGLVVVCSVGVMLSAYMTPSAAATMSFIVCFGSNMIVRSLTMASSNQPPEMITFFQVINASIPQVGLFDFGSRVANSGWSTVPAWVMGSLVGYMIAYSVAMLILTWAKFQRQAL